MVALPLVFKIIKVVMKKKMTLLTFLVHITSLVVNNLTASQYTEKIVCHRNLLSKSEHLLLLGNGVLTLMMSV